MDVMEGIDKVSSGRQRSQAGETFARLLNPRSIALVGASDRSLWSSIAHDNLVRLGYAGRIHAVNPKGGTIHGRIAATSCREIGEPIDTALLMVPEAALVDALRDLGDAGGSGAVILSSGFAETGESGKARQAELARIAAEAGIRLIGPNCLGFANYIDTVPLWATPLRRPLPNPKLAIVSQSGAVAGQLQQFAYQQRIALTHLISTGNEADADVADAIDYLVSHSPARSIAVFLEAVRNPDRFAMAVAGADAAGKPVIVFKIGTSEAAAKAAQTHTGSIVGDDRVFDAMCRRLGVIRAHSLEDLIVTADLAGRLGRIETQGFALMAGSGGICEIAVDQADKEGVNMPALQPDTVAALEAVLPSYAHAGNPLDVTGAVMQQPGIIADAMQAISADPAVGLVAYVFDSPQKDDAQGSARLLMSQIGQGMAASSKPTLMISNTLAAVSGPARELAEECGIVYTGGGVNHAMTAIGAIFRWSARRDVRPLHVPDAPERGERPSGERGVLDHLSRHGTPVVPAALVGDAGAAVAAARTMGGPVVLKIASPDIPHKTEVGGVVLDLQGDGPVGDACRAMLDRVEAARPDAKIDGVIVSPMRRGGVELFVGTMRDPQWGPAIAVGLGGVLVEVFDDVSLRLLPVTRAEALDMLGELRGARLLDGVRGAAPVDRGAIADAVVAIANAALALGPDLVSLEVNPLLATEAGVEALDGLVSWNDDHAHA